jgi:hypothetical protein
VVFGHAHQYFLTVWFQREWDKALLSAAIMELVLWSMVKSKTENDMQAKFPMTSNDGFSLCDDDELA